MMSFFKKVLNISKPKNLLIRANALKDYKHFEEALIEAEKARDYKYATTEERELAKGTIIQILGTMRKEEVEKNSTNLLKL